MRNEYNSNYLGSRTVSRCDNANVLVEEQQCMCIGSKFLVIIVSLLGRPRQTAREGIRK